MNKVHSFTFATVCSALLLAEPVLAEPITVTPEVSRTAFVQKVSKDLDRQLERAARWEKADGDGIAIVRFTRTAEGRPDNISLYRKSGGHNLDRTAMRAVDKLDLTEGIPAGARQDQVYQANIIFASSVRGHAKMAAQLAQEEAVRLAMGEEKQVLALGSAAARPSS